MRKNVTGGITGSDFRLDYKAMVIKIYGIGTKKTHISMKYKRPEINPLTYVQLIYNKEGKNKNVQ